MKFRALFPVVVSFLLAPSAFAFRLSPMVLDFSPSGKGSTQTLQLENPGKESVAVQLEVMKRKIAENGEEDRSELAKDFVIFPEQLKLEPGQKRNVRITWTGDADPKQELPFRLVASQLPVELKRPTDRADVKVNLKFVLQYVASLYVVPAGAKSEVKVAEVKPAKDGKVDVVVVNEGTTRRVLEKAHIRFLAGGRSLDANEAEMKDLRTQNILAGTKRRFRLSVPGDFKNPKAEISFE